MSGRKPDVVVVESMTARNGRFVAFEFFSQVKITNDIDGAAEAIFEFGDDRAFRELEDYIQPGTEYRVKVNGYARLSGRAEVYEAPVDPRAGTKINLTVRTKMVDARIRSADPASVNVKGTVKEMVLSAYKPLGYAEKDFIFSNAAKTLELTTGKRVGTGPPTVSVGGTTAKTPAEQLVIIAQPLEKAKVQPPITIYDFVKKHLERFRMAHWDAPDGRIFVGAPDDSQAPLYTLISMRAGPNANANNVLEMRPKRDWSEVPRTVTVFGQTYGKDITTSQFQSRVTEQAVDRVAKATGHFQRDVIVSSSDSRSVVETDAQASRELSKRVKKTDAIDCKCDGFSWWSGHEQVNWAINSVADVQSDYTGGRHGRYLITKTELVQLPESGRTTSLTLIAPGLWST